MATFTKTLLSGSTQGQPITVAATASTGTTIHATGTSSSIIDEVWLYANNTNSSPVVLTVQFGGTGAVQHAKPITLAPQSGDVLIVAGLPLIWIALQELGLINKRSGHEDKLKVHAICVALFLVFGHIAMITGMLDPTIFGYTEANAHQMDGGNMSHESSSMQMN